MIHVHNMKVGFPCLERAWQASTLASWSALRPQAHQPRPGLLEASRRLISRCEIHPESSYFEAWIILHALVNISWALLWRDMAHLCKDIAADASRV